MKRTRCIALLCAVVASAAYAQSVPVEKEPLHRSVYEDKEIRILEIQIPPGTESMMHSHRNDGIHITVQGARVSEKTPRGWWASTHEASERGLTYFSGLNGREFEHQIKNIDTVATHIIAVELLTPLPTTPKAVVNLPYAEPIASNARTEFGRIKLAPGARSALPTLPERLLLVSIAGGRLLVGNDRLELKPGALHWLPAGPARELIAGEGSAVELVAIQFK
jgi:quercetin dioxygenase-like cupin family protein